MGVSLEHQQHPEQLFPASFRGGLEQSKCRGGKNTNGALNKNIHWRLKHRVFRATTYCFMGLNCRRNAALCREYSFYNSFIKKQWTPVPLLPEYI